MGGRGASLAAALTYSHVVFSGAILIWTFNSLANVIRGTGNMAVPAIVTCVGAVGADPALPVPHLRLGAVPAAGRRGRRVAVVAYYALGTIAFALYLWTGAAWSTCRSAPSGCAGRCSATSCGVGLVAALVTVTTN